MAGFITRLLERRRMEREGQLGTRKRRTESVWGEAADRSPILTLALTLVLWGVCLTVLTLPELRNYPVLVANQVAPSTIFAQVDFVYEDSVATRQAKQAAADKQLQCFRVDKRADSNVINNMNTLFTVLHERLASEAADKKYTASDNHPVAQAVAALGPSAFQVCARLEHNSLQREQFGDEVRRLLQNWIIDLKRYNKLTAEDSLMIADSDNRVYRRQVSSLMSCAHAARQLTMLIAGYSPDVKLNRPDTEALERLMLTMLNHTGNIELDQVRTMERRQRAMAAVDPVIVEVKKNSQIIKRGALVTENVLDAINAQQRMLEKYNQEDDRLQNLIHNSFWSLTLILFAGFYLLHIHPDIAHSSRSIAMIVTICALSLGINFLAMETFYFFSGMLAIPPELVADALPLALPAVLLAVVSGYRVALYVGLFVSMISALMLGGSFNTALEGFVLSALCGLMVRPSGNYRSFFLRAFFCTLIATWMLDFNMFWRIVSAPTVLAYSLALAVVNALFTAVAAVVLIFLFELLFNVSTNMSLMVLCDYNHPLLKELHLKAPGTSLHSQNVAVLAENAAMDINANAVLARAGALFHDIGKVKNPEYFIENNQSSTNPHNKLNPRMSSLIISNHVKDGLDMALQHKLCRSVRQFIQQHHGTDLIQYFYHLALSSSDDQVLESDYRYPGPLPHAKEVVIVSLADACEAACRSLEKPTASKIETMVNDIFRKRWRDGQLDEANLTVEELSRINESFVRTLTTMYHSRIAYPKDENNDEDNIFVPERPTPGAE